MCNTGKKILIWQRQNPMSNFPKLFKVSVQQKSENKSGPFIYKFSRNPDFNPWFKNRFQGTFMVKVIDTKKIHSMYLTLYSHVLKTSLLLLAAGLSMYYLFITNHSRVHKLKIR